MHILREGFCESGTILWNRISKFWESMKWIYLKRVRRLLVVFLYSMYDLNNQIENRFSREGRLQKTRLNKGSTFIAYELKCLKLKYVWRKTSLMTSKDWEMKWTDHFFFCFPNSNHIGDVSQNLSKWSIHGIWLCNCLLYLTVQVAYGLVTW